MTPIFQNIYHPTKGDCHRASMASLFDIDLEQVPHFGLYSKERWPYAMQGFIWGMGYEWTGNGKPGKDLLDSRHSVNGFFEASVPGGSVPTHAAHSVIIDLSGIVVHDPDKGQAWNGINVLESGQLQWWTMIEKRADG